LNIKDIESITMNQIDASVTKKEKSWPLIGPFYELKKDGVTVEWTTNKQGANTLAQHINADCYEILGGVKCLVIE
jgi:hypothetical protein